MRRTQASGDDENAAIRFIAPGVAHIACGLSAITTLIACNTEQASQAQTVTVPETKLWDKAVLNVCWENSIDGKLTDSTENFRSSVKTFVTEQFSKTVLRMVGWGTCRPGGSDIRLFIYDDASINRTRALSRLRDLVNKDPDYLGSGGHPRVRYWARELRGKEAGVVLNMNFINVIPAVRDVYNRLDGVGKRNLALSGSLHELGHAIGLRHEDSHNSIERCAEYREDLDDGVIVSGYNATSFMSRCFYRKADYNKGPVRLNAKDIEGINIAYKKFNSEIR